MVHAPTATPSPTLVRVRSTRPWTGARWRGRSASTTRTSSSGWTTSFSTARRSASALQLHRSEDAFGSWLSTAPYRPLTPRDARAGSRSRTPRIPTAWSPPSRFAGRAGPARWRRRLPGRARSSSSYPSNWAMSFCSRRPFVSPERGLGRGRGAFSCPCSRVMQHYPHAVYNIYYVPPRTHWSMVKRPLGWVGQQHQVSCPIVLS